MIYAVYLIKRLVFLHDIYFNRQTSDYFLLFILKFTQPNKTKNGY